MGVYCLTFAPVCQFKKLLREAPAVQPAGLLELATTSSPLRLLCLDDEPLLRELLKEILEFHHHQVPAPWRSSPEPLNSRNLPPWPGGLSLL